MDDDEDASRWLAAVHGPAAAELLIAVPPAGTGLQLLSSDTYPAPAMWDGDEWASLTPCHLQWIVRELAEFAATGRVELPCPFPGCDLRWHVVWDPRKRSGRLHALWLHP